MSKVVPLLETLFMNKGGQPELWKAIIKVINSKPEEAKYFAQYAKSKMKDLNQETQLLALDLVDFVVDEGKIPLWTQIASKDFLTSLIGILKTRDAPEVQLKILYLIKKWGTKFESYKEILPNFSEFYKSLKSTGSIIFPDDYEPEYIKYIGDYKGVQLEAENRSKSPKVEKKSRESKESPMNNYKDDFLGGNDFGREKKSKHRNSPDDEDDTKKLSDGSSKSYKIDLNPDNYDKKYTKLINKLSIWFENIILANDMIDNTKVGTQIDDGLRYVMENLRVGEKELVVYIQEKVKNEKILELCLGVNDDLNKTITRYDLIRSKSKPEPFKSNFEYRGSRNSRNSGTEHKKSSRNKSRNNDLERSSSKSPIREPKKSHKPSNDPFDVFDLKNQVTNLSTGDKKVSKNLSGQTSNNVKTVDDIFEIFGGNMNVNTNVNAYVNINNPNNNLNNNDSNLRNKVNNQFNIDFDSFSNQQNDVNKNLNEPVFNLVGNSNSIGNENINNNQSNILNNNLVNHQTNARPGIDSLAEKLKNIYNAKEDESTNLNMTNNKRTISPNMNAGMNNFFNFPGQSQPQFANFNNVIPGYNMMQPGMMTMNMQSQQMNMMNMGLNPMNPINPINNVNQINNLNQVNQMSTQYNRFNPGLDSDFQIRINNNNNLNNNNIQNDPFNFGGN